jgi:ABC-type cobalamin/Fe3+-siderophores transport system ATPase subunit
MLCMSQDTAISVAGLYKSYGENDVLKGVDLEVPEGSVYALLGANGAGKTTAVNICSTLLTADAGEVRVAGYDVRTHADQVRRTRRAVVAGRRAAPSRPRDLRGCRQGDRPATARRDQAAADQPQADRRSSRPAGS